MGWEKRLLQEKKEIDARISRINSHIKNNLFNTSWEEERLLIDQRTIMRRYADILAARIYNLKETDEEN